MSVRPAGVGTAAAGVAVVGGGGCGGDEGCGAGAVEHGEGGGGRDAHQEVADVGVGRRRVRALAAHAQRGCSSLKRTMLCLKKQVQLYIYSNGERQV